MFKLSTKARYAVRIMICIAEQSPEQISAGGVAEAEGISRNYVEQILVRLRAAGLVRSKRGSSGGFVLGCDPEQASVLDILTAVEGPLALVPCMDEQCKRSTACVAQGVWREVGAAVTKSLGSAKLATLAEEARALRRKGSISFEI